MTTAMEQHGLQVGDVVLFDHFGSKDRRGRVVKITRSAVHVEWTAPSSLLTRTVAISTKIIHSAEWTDHNGRVWPARDYSQFRAKNIRKVETR